MYEGNFSDVAEQFFPNSEELENKESLNNFYVLDTVLMFDSITVSYVLEFQFDNSLVYETFLNKEKTRIEYTNKYEIIKNGYKCSIANDNPLILYRYGAERPFLFCLLCENSLNLCVRFVMFCWGGDMIDEDFENVFKYTNSDWS
jgi:hypothetical protein